MPENYREAIQGFDLNKVHARRLRIKQVALDPRPSLAIGSDVEIACCVRGDLEDRFGRVVHAEGQFWRYNGIHWEPIQSHECRLAVHRFDGARYLTGSGSAGLVKLTKGKINSILHELAALVANADFFMGMRTGINSAAGFITFSEDGTATVEPHHPDHRCRHTLPGHWRPGVPSEPPKDSLLAKFLKGIFQGDPDATEKLALLSEVCGAAALGYATRLMQPRCVVLYGQTAENGKSQVLDLARGLLPPDAVCVVPAAKMSDERHVIALAGKLLNASDELSSNAITADVFKAVVTGEWLQGRDVFRSRIEFRPRALHLFSTNALPPFRGGMDRGVQRRLLVIPFSRVIPIDQRVENIGQRIAEREQDVLLSWAVQGASRLVRQRNFSIPDSCKQALDDWIFGADPVLAWVHECVEIHPMTDGLAVIPTRVAYTQFHEWAASEGFKTLPAIGAFVQRVQANGVQYRRTNTGRFFANVTVLRQRN